MEPSFAFCYSQIVPASGIEWQEHSTIDPPRPPIGWRKTGFGQGWHGWKAGETWPLSAEDIIPRRATSIIWRQPQQCFWIAPIDYTTIRGELDPVEDWSHLYFHDLGLETNSQRGLFKLLGHGTERQLPLACPERFDEFLPKHCFRGEEKKPCHLVGDLSLMLALHALVPEQEDNISNHIKEFFFRGNNSSLQSCRDHNQWEAMDRCSAFANPFASFYANLYRISRPRPRHADRPSAWYRKL